MRAHCVFVACAIGLALLPGCVGGGACCPSPCRVACCPGTFVDVTPAPETKEPEKPKPFATGGEKTTWEYLLKKYDTDGDGAVTAEEHGRGEKAFKNLDQDRDGRVTAEDFERADRMHQYVTQSTVARYFQADEKPRDLHLSEVEAAFAQHDANGDGELSEDEFEAARKAVDASATKSPVPAMPAGVDPLESLRAVVDTDGNKSFSLAELTAYFKTRDDDGDGAWKMRRRRRPGAAAPTGPAPGTDAPDFTLEPPEGGKPVTLSTFKGKKPVALIFGSYT